MRAKKNRDTGENPINVTNLCIVGGKNSKIYSKIFENQSVVM